MKHARPWILCVLFFCSGAAGLAYQMVWVRMFAAGLGHEVPAMMAVASAFLGGMAVGAWLLGQRIRISPAPTRWYGWLELLIGIWGAVSGLFIPMLNDLALRLTGPAPSATFHWAVAFALPLLVLLPATTAMGATLPAMERTLAPYTRGGRSVGAFYAANTFGAFAGTLAGAFLLMPWLGFRFSLLGLGLGSVACGLAALQLNRSRPDPASAQPRSAPAPARQLAHRPGKELSAGRLALAVFATGVLGIACQFVGIRLLSQVLENTVYSYAAALAVYLAGTAVGASLYQRWAGAWDSHRTLTWCLAAVTVAWVLGARSATTLRAVYEACRDLLGDGIGGVLAAEMTAAGMILGLPTLFMGMLFSHLVQAAARSAAGVGRAAALNTLGCALAIGLVGLWLLPSLGAKGSAITIALGYLLLVPVLKGWDWAAVAVALGCASALLWPADLRLVQLSTGARLMDYRESIYGAVAVVQTTDGHRSLRVNNRLQMGGTAAALAERRQAHLPLLLHPNPKQALFLGPGTGITVGAATEHPGLQIEGVELVPAILELMPAFARENRGVATNARVRWQAGDARRFVRTTPNRYDVVVADLFHPAQDGAGFLYTREHFEAVRSCLNEGGLFCQWLPLHQLGVGELKAIVRTFLESFPQAQGWLLHFNVDIPVLGLVGTERPAHWNGARLEARLHEPALRGALRDAGFDRALQVLGCLAADAVSLRAYAGHAAVSSDDHPAVLFFAPYHAARRHVRSFEVLMGFLENATTQPERARLSKAHLEPGQDLLAGHLEAFIQARDLYLRGLIEESDGNLPAATDLYLESARESLFFTPAYARCVTIIQLLAEADRERARQLFRRLEAAQPAQPLGKKMLGPLLEETK